VTRDVFALGVLLTQRCRPDVGRTARLALQEAQLLRERARIIEGRELKSKIL